MRRNIAIAAGGSVAVLLLFFVAVVRPVTSKISETDRKVATAQSQVAQLSAQIQVLQQAQQSAPLVAARLAKIDLLLPRTTDLPTFIRQVQQASDDSAVDLASIAPSAPVVAAAGQGIDPAIAGKSVYTMNAVLTVNAGFFALVAFLHRLESMQRVVEVQNLAISPSTDESGTTTLAVTITVTMFVVNPSSAIVPGTVASPSPSPSSSGGGGQSGPATPSSSSPTSSASP